MATAKLVLEADLTPIESAFQAQDQMLSNLNKEAKAFGQTGRTAFKAVTEEAAKLDKEIKNGGQALSKEWPLATKTIPAAASRLKELKKEIKELTSAAIVLGQQGDLVGANKAAREAGKLKDELKDVQDLVKSVSGNVKENLAGAFGKATRIGAQGFELVAAASALAGDENKEFQKDLLKLQAIQSIARIAGEFGDIGDRLREIKLGLSPLTSLFTNANSKIAAFFSSGTSGVKEFTASGVTGMKSLKVAIAENPLGILLVTVLALITAFVAFKDRIKLFGDGWKYVSDQISQGVDNMKKFLQYLNLLESDFEKMRDKTINSTEEVNKAIGRRYDREIKLLQATGRETLEVELKKLNAQKNTIVQAIAALYAKRRVQGELSEEEIKKFQELQEELRDLNADGLALQAAARKKAADKKKEDDKKAADEAKKQAEKQAQLRKDLNDKLKSLFNDSQQAEIALLEGEPKIAKQKEVALRLLENTKQDLIKAGQLTDKNFKLSAEQLKEFQTLELKIYADATDEYLKLNEDRAKRAAEEAEKAATERKTALENQEKAAIAGVELTRNEAGQKEEDFERQKQIRVLQIQQEFAIKKLELLRGDKNFAGLQDETAAFINGLQKQIDELNKKSKGVDLLKMMGITPEQMQAAQQAGQSLTEFTDSIIQIQQQGLDREREIVDAKIAERDKNINDLESKLEKQKAAVDKEDELGRKGLANNEDRARADLAITEAQIAEEKKLREQALAEQAALNDKKRKMALAQLAIDSIIQGTNLITASSQIIKDFTTAFPVVGLPLGIAAVATMIGGFLASKVAAFDAVQNQKFAKGKIGIEGPGTETSDSIQASLSKGESVMTARETKDNYKLLRGIHDNDNSLIGEGILDLVRTRSIIFNQSQKIIERKNAIQSFNTNVDMSPTEKHLAELNRRQEAILKESRRKIFVDHNGNLVTIEGSHTTIRRK